MRRRRSCEAATGEAAGTGLAGAGGAAAEGCFSAAAGEAGRAGDDVYRMRCSVVVLYIKTRRRCLDYTTYLTINTINTDHQRQHAAGSVDTLDVMMMMMYSTVQYTYTVQYKKNKIPSLDLF